VPPPRLAQPARRREPGDTGRGCPTPLIAVGTYALPSAAIYDAFRRYSVGGLIERAVKT
jgi:hypothetical protein